jgi:UDP:flavonoid glycosyltransferase YjiC (YdhE family)
VSRILLATIGSLGDLHPLIAIAMELRRRGHTVRFATSETYRPKLESLGFGFDSMRPDATPENPAMAQMVKEIMDPVKGTERLIKGLIMPRLQETCADLVRAVTGPSAIDLLVSGELVYPAPLIAEKFGVRWASCTTAPMSFFSAYDPAILPPVPRLSALLRALGPGVNKAAIHVIKMATRSWSEPVLRLRAELGLPVGRSAIYEGKFSPNLVLAIFSSALAVPQPDWPPNTVVTGFPFYDGECTPEPESQPLADFLNSGDPPIIFTLGSSAVLDPGNFYQESAEAARLLNRRALLLVGRNPHPSRLPEGVIAHGYARYSEVFPRAKAVVHQGGVGTTGQALRAGCPMLVMPYNFDQQDNAARIARLEVGKVISRKNYSAKLAARSLSELIENPQYARNAEEISRAVQKERGAETACDALERLIEKG